MKKIFLALAFITALAAQAQKKFDSAAYADFYSNRWEKINWQAVPDASFPEQLPETERLSGLAKAWAEAKYNFGNFDLVPRLNWDSLYTAYIPKVQAASNTVAYYRVLKSFYQHLRDGHSSINLPFGYRKTLGTLPLQVRWVEGRALVTGNWSDREGERSIEVGAELLTINGEPLQTFIQQHISPYLHFSTPQDSTERIYRYELLRGRLGEAWQLGFRNRAGKLVTQSFAFRQMPPSWMPFPLLSFRVLKGNVGYLQLNAFGSEEIVRQFDSIYPALSKTAALIIDLRNNGGGNGDNGFAILARLTGQPFATGKQVVRRYRPVGRSWGGVEEGNIQEDEWKPRDSSGYSAPVVLLTSGATYSAAEDFAGSFKSMRRGLIVGEPTGGSTGQPVFFTLPGGGLGAVCSKRDFLSDGTEFIGLGIQPDVLVHPTAASVAAGKDDVLEAAVQQLRKK